MDILLILLVAAPLAFDIKYFKVLHEIVREKKKLRPKNVFYTWIDIPYALCWLLIVYTLLLLPTLFLFLTPISLIALAVVTTITLDTHYFIELYKIKNSKSKPNGIKKNTMKRNIKKLTYSLLALLICEAILIYYEINQ